MTGTPDIEVEMPIERTIMRVLNSKGRMTLRGLMRKVSAHRFMEFDECLEVLSDAGKLTIETDPEIPGRKWVCPVSTLSANP